MDTNKQIFISYSWQDKAIVDEIDNHFLSIGINLIRDVREIAYKESIYQFMKKIRNSDFVILVISDSYLKSLNCMNEILELIKDEDFSERILHIIPYSDIKKADIFNPLGKIKYINFWQSKYQEFKRKLETIEDINKGLIINDLKKYQTISSSIGDFIITISDMLYVTFEELKISKYKLLIEKIGLENSPLILKLLEIDSTISFDEKINNIDSIIYENPLNFIGYLYKGILLYKNKFYKQAIFNLKKCSELNAINPIPLTYIGSAFDELGEYSEAIEYYQKSIEINPNWGKTLVWQGITYDNLNKYKDALSSYSRALQLNPLSIEEIVADRELSIYRELKIESDKVFYNRGLSYYNSNQYEEAIWDFKKAIEINPSDYDYYYYLALSMIYKDDIKSFNFNEALELLDKASKSGDDISEIHFYKGEIFFIKKDYRSALKEYAIAAKLNPQELRYIQTKGLCNYKLRNFLKAEKDWKRTIKLFPEDALAYVCLIELYIISNRIEQTGDLVNEFAYTQPTKDESLFFNFLLNLANILQNKEPSDYLQKFRIQLEDFMTIEYDLEELESFIKSIKDSNTAIKFREIVNLLKGKTKTPLPNNV